MFYCLFIVYLVPPLRLSSHDLAIEKGRWSRVPRESRLCECKEIQTEEHILCFCPKTEFIRQNYANEDFTNIESLFRNTNPSVLAKICKLCYEAVL